MRYLPIKKVEAGMVLAQDILDGQGVMLLGRHQILNQEQIENLDKMGYPGLYIDDKFSEEIEIAEVIKPSIHSKSLEIVHHLFIDRMEEEDVSEQEWQIREAVMQVVDSLLENEEVMYNMMSLKNYDDYTYFHSVNVGILSAVIGAHYGMDEYELRILTTAALLHDIGKKFLEIDILNARRALTEEERRIVLQHPKLGYEFLRDNFDFAPEVYLGVLEHHECYNGEGYPMRKSGDEISIYGRIIKLADVYDAMISKRPYRDPMPPADVIEYIMAMNGSEFDPKLVEVFLADMGATHAKNNPALMEAGKQLGRQVIELAANYPIHTSELAISGREITQICPHHSVGQLLNYLLQRVQSGNLANNKETLLAALHKYLNKH